jgi:3alpha(or 20beta)-hydroxysteroid dehydrogenase
MTVADKVIIVTGAAQGMGLATAEMLVEEGAHVIMTDVNGDEGARVAAELGDRAQFVRMDVSEEKDWTTAVDAILARHGRVDGLVNNAAIFINALIEEMPPADFRRLIEIDLYGPWLGMRAVVPIMKKARSGSIVNISSVEGLMGHCGRTGYTAAKWGLRGMTKSLALETGPYGVRVNSVQPGAINTPMLQNGMAGESFDRFFPEVSMNRPGEPNEIAAVTTFLLSDKASYVNGAEITADGGWTCGQYRVNKPKPVVEPQH